MQEFNQQEDYPQNLHQNQFQIHHSNRLLDQLQKKMQKHFQKRSEQYVNTQYLDKSRDYLEQPSDRFLITSNYRKIQQNPNQLQASKNIAKVSLQMMLNTNQQKVKQLPKKCSESQSQQKLKYSNSKPSASTKKQFYNNGKGLQDIREVVREKNIEKQGSFKLFKKKKQNVEKNQQPQKSYRQAQSFPRILQGELKSFSLNDYLSRQRHFDNKNGHSKQIYNQSQSLLAHQHFKSVQNLLNNRLKIKEGAIEHLQNELRIGNQQRVHHYKINLQLEQQYKQLLQNQQNQEKQIYRQLQNQLQLLKKQLQEKKTQKKNLKKQQKILKQQFATFLKNRKEYIKREQFKLEQELQNNRGMANQSNYDQRNKIFKNKTTPKPKIGMKTNSQKRAVKNGIPSYDVLISLVSQLDRIKDIVEKQMRDSRSKGKC